MLELLLDNLKLFKFIINSKGIFTAAVPVIKLQADSSILFEDMEICDCKIPIKVDIIVEL